MTKHPIESASFPDGPHGGANGLGLSCDRCNFRGKTRAALKKHLTENHQDENPHGKKLHIPAKSRYS